MTAYRLTAVTFPLCQAEKVFPISIGDTIRLGAIRVFHGPHAHVHHEAVEGCDGLLVLEEVEKINHRGYLQNISGHNAYMWKIVSGRGTTFQVVERDGDEIVRTVTYRVSF
jgi:hypothetical protein